MNAALLPVTDIHTHIVPASFPASLGGQASAIEIRPGCDCGRAEVYVDGKHFRSITNECWDVGVRAERMGALGVGRQVLSPMPELLSYWRPADEAAAIADYVNAALAEMIASDADRFCALGMVPLQDPDRAIAMLEQIMVIPGIRGVEIGTNIAGLGLSDARFAAFFAAAERLGAAVLVHPVKPTVSYAGLAAGPLQALSTFACETALAATALIASNLLEAHPGLRLALSHGGGVLALILPRMDHGWAANPALRETIRERPSLAARRFYYDTLVYDAATLRFLVQQLGDERLCVGTDLPFPIAEADPIGRLTEADLSGEVISRITRLNPARFLGLS